MPKRTDLPKLRRQLARMEIAMTRARKKRNAVSERIADIENAALSGRCFKYPNNNYGASDELRRSWPIYRRFGKVMKDGAVERIEFQTDCYGKVTIETGPQEFPSKCGYVEITVTEFNAAWLALTAALDGALTKPVTP